MPEATEQKQNVDDLLSGNNPAEDEQRAPNPEPQPEPESDPESESPEFDQPESDEATPEPDSESDSEFESDEDTDDYGNPKESKKDKLYTEEEVNERINKAMRERFARMKQENQPTEQQQQATEQQASQDFVYDENSSQSWEQQIESLIENTMTKVQQKQSQKQREQVEQQRQQEFVEKLNNGAAKFPDFESVTGDKPFTQEMVHATRGMSDPASFLYAASKNHADELTRISQLPDPVQQMTEMTRLENKIRVNRKGKSKAPTPASKTPQGSASVGEESVDALIDKHAKAKAKMRGWVS